MDEFSSKTACVTPQNWNFEKKLDEFSSETACVTTRKIKVSEKIRVAGGLLLLLIVIASNIYCAIYWFVSLAMELTVVGVRIGSSSMEDVGHQQLITKAAQSVTNI